MKLRIIVVGPTCSGKTTLVNRYVNNTFSDVYDITIGVEFLTKYLIVNNKQIQLQIWDCAGHDTFKSITRNYYKNSCIALCVFDLSSRSSFQSVLSHIRESKEFCEDYVTIALVGNKSDLKSITVTSADIEAVVNDDPNIMYFEVSSKLNRNVENLFQSVVAKALEKIEKGLFNPDESLKMQSLTRQEIVNQEYCCILS